MRASPYSRYMYSSRTKFLIKGRHTTQWLLMKAFRKGVPLIIDNQVAVMQQPEILFPQTLDTPPLRSHLNLQCVAGDIAQNCVLPPEPFDILKTLLRIVQNLKDFLLLLMVGFCSHLAYQGLRSACFAKPLSPHVFFRHSEGFTPECLPCAAGPVMDDAIFRVENKSVGSVCKK